MSLLTKCATPRLFQTGVAEGTERGLPDLADIKSGDFVATTSMKGTDGKNHSVELRIFPESMRGLGEGQYAWDLMPDSLMINATVTGVARRRRAKT
jgi:hypothetical protein